MRKKHQIIKISNFMISDAKKNNISSNMYMHIFLKSPMGALHETNSNNINVFLNICLI